MKRLPSIQVFAIDIKARYSMSQSTDVYGCSTAWTLPYVRIGVDGVADSSVTDKCWYQQLQLPVSEFNGICRVAMSLPDFGNPDYIGFCHYRRFFTSCASQPVVQFQQLEVDQSVVLSQAEQLQIMLQNNAAGIVPFPFLEHYKQDPKNIHFNAQPDSLAQYFLFQFEDDHAGFTLDDVQFALDCLVEFSPDSLKPFVQQAMQMRAVHFCSLFTMRTDLFREMFDVVFKTMNMLMIHIGHDRLLEMNGRCGGYMCERLFSVMIWAFKLYKKRLISLPIAVTACNQNPVYRRMTSKDAGLACNVDELKRQLDTIKSSAQMTQSFQPLP